MLFKRDVKKSNFSWKNFNKSYKTCKINKIVRDTCFGEQWFIKELQPLSDIINSVSTFQINGINLMINMWVQSPERQLMPIEIKDKYAAYFIVDLYLSAITTKFLFLFPWKHQFLNLKKILKKISTRQEFYKCFINKLNHFNFFLKFKWNFAHKIDSNFYLNLFITL